MFHKHGLKSKFSLNNSNMTYDFDQGMKPKWNYHYWKPILVIFMEPKQCSGNNWSNW